MTRRAVGFPCHQEGSHHEGQGAAKHLESRSTSATPVVSAGLLSQICWASLSLGFPSSSQLPPQILPPYIFTFITVKYLQTDTPFSHYIWALFNSLFSAKRLLPSRMEWDKTKGWGGPRTPLVSLVGIRKGVGESVWGLCSFISHQLGCLWGPWPWGEWNSCCWILIGCSLEPLCISAYWWDSCAPQAALCPSSSAFQLSV